MGVMDEEYRKIEYANFEPNKMLTAAAIAELAGATQRIQRVSFRVVVLCEHCTIKKAVPHNDGMIWRCPHRTHDVNLEGFCEYGRRAE